MNIIRFLLVGFMYFCDSNYAAELAVNVDAKNSYFVGRTSEIGQLSLDFKDKPTILLKGGKGIGKTQIAKEYVWQNLSHYDFIWWINGSEDIEPQAIYFAKKINAILPEREKVNSAGNAELVFQKIIQTLLNSNKKWLIVFDDVNYPINHLIDFNQLSSAKKHHVLTTAYNCDFIKMFTSVITIKSFDRQDSVTLLSRLDQKQYK
ncbi:NB-ARC domain-containing protein, partial [Cysteiniphilum litorale]